MTFTKIINTNLITMEDSLIIQLKSFCLLLSITFYISMTPVSSLNPSTNSISKNGRLVMKLIHRDLIYPPKYPSRVSDQISRAWRSSKSRLNHLISLKSNQTSLPKKSRAPLVSADGIYMANISIGTPQIHQLVSIDTGSNFLWIQCQPCTKCQTTKNPIYDPSKSRSFRESSCEWDTCRLYPGGGGCDKEKNCKYSIEYADGSFTAGYLASEVLSLGTSDKHIAAIRDVPFGCGTSNQNKNPAEDGVFGLAGNNETSIHSVTDGKFSYCLGNISDPNDAYNFLAFGNDSYLRGPSAPFKLSPEGFYYVSLEGINIGETELQFNRKDFEFNVLVDSGATFSVIKRDVYEAIKSQVQKLVAGELQQVPLAGVPEALCYKGHLGRDLKWFPLSSLRFGGETEMILGKSSLFWRVPGEETFCLAMEPGDGNENVLGVVAQQYHNFGFDLNSKKFFVERVACQYIDINFGDYDP